MSNSQPADARAALMETVISRASAEGVSPSSLLRRPSRNFNTRDFAGRNQSASPTKHRGRQDKSGLVIRGRTIYNPQAESATHSAPKTSRSHTLMKSTARSFGSEEKSMSLEILQRMDADEQKRKKGPYQRFLKEGRSDFAQKYRMNDEGMSAWMGASESGAHCLARGSERSTPSLSPSSVPSDMEYSPLRWNAPAFNSGEGDWQAIFDMYVKQEECLEDSMRY